MNSVCVCVCVYQQRRVYISFLSQIRWASPSRLARMFPALALGSASFLRNSSILGKPRQLVTQDTATSVLVLSDATELLQSLFSFYFPSFIEM